MRRGGRQSAAEGTAGLCQKQRDEGGWVAGAREEQQQSRRFKELAGQLGMKLLISGFWQQDTLFRALIHNPYHFISWLVCPDPSFESRSILQR